MRSKILFCLSSCFLLMLLTCTAEATAVKTATHECEGNACAVVTLTWDEERQQFRVKNDSNQPVKVEVSTFAGTSSLSVPAKEVGYLEVKNFHGPYRATYE